MMCTNPLVFQSVCLIISSSNLLNMVAMIFFNKHVFMPDSTDLECFSAENSKAGSTGAVNSTDAVNIFC